VCGKQWASGRRFRWEEARDSGTAQSGPQAGAWNSTPGASSAGNTKPGPIVMAGLCNIEQKSGMAVEDDVFTRQMFSS
jgi:hypothetical protein